MAKSQLNEIVRAMLSYSQNTDKGAHINKTEEDEDITITFGNNEEAK